MNSMSMSQGATPPLENCVWIGLQNLKWIFYGETIFTFAGTFFKETRLHLTRKNSPISKGNPSQHVTSLIYLSSTFKSQRRYTFKSLRRSVTSDKVIQCTRRAYLCGTTIPTSGPAWSFIIRTANPKIV